MDQWLDGTATPRPDAAILHEVKAPDDREVFEGTSIEEHSAMQARDSAKSPNPGSDLGG